MADLISPQELYRRIAAEEHITIIDVRNPELYREGHISGAINIPLEELEDRMGEIPQNRPVVTY